MSFILLVEQAAPETPSANQVVFYPKSDGLLYSKDDAGTESVIASGAATQAQQEAAVSTSVFTSPGRQHFHPGHPKAFIAFNGTGTPAVLASYNMDGVTPITDNGAGDYSLNFGTDFSTADYSAAGCCQGDITSNTGRTASAQHKLGGTRSAATFQAGVSQGVRFDIVSGGSPLDSAYVSYHFLGDQ